jgi:hypothetical protein
MKDPPQRPLGRVAMVLVLSGLLLTLAGLTYMIRLRWDSMPTDAGGPDSPALEPMQRLRLTLAMLLFAVLAILIFVISTYVVIRLGRSVMERRLGDTPTKYVDVWAGYRVSQQEMDDLEQTWSEDDNSARSDDNSDETDRDDDDSQDERRTDG